MKKVYRDIYGKKVEKNPVDYPTSYDEYVRIFNFPEKNDNIITTDEMIAQNEEKYNECCRKMYNQKNPQFRLRDLHSLHSFISMYLGQNVLVTAFTEGCNKETGLPYWGFYYH